jgi:hypothetical protein
VTNTRQNRDNDETSASALPKPPTIPGASARAHASSALAPPQRRVQAPPLDRTCLASRRGSVAPGHAYPEAPPARADPDARPAAPFRPASRRHLATSGVFAASSDQHVFGDAATVAGDAYGAAERNATAELVLEDRRRPEQLLEPYDPSCSDRDLPVDREDLVIVAGAS